MEAMLPQGRQWCVVSQPLTREELEQTKPGEAQPGQKLLQAALEAIGRAAIEAKLPGFGKPEIADYDIVEGNKVSMVVCSLVETDKPPPTAALIGRTRPALKVWALACPGRDIETCDAELSRQLKSDRWNLDGATIDAAERLSARVPRPRAGGVDFPAALTSPGAFIADPLTGAITPAPLEGELVTIDAIVAPDD
ncbi:hypothetical protein CK226_20805 [Mesorhizobium sp. WSM4311]|nr:hypothetical protein CK226_20805 [Mesorhizobium sp. WSM4311]